MTPDYQTPERMAAKLKAIPLPDLSGKSVLDVGCDMRAWEDVARGKGANAYVGVDRGRSSRGNGFINLADVKMDLGVQYHETGRHDVVFCFSMYHHAYASAGGNHDAIWFWLSRQTKPGGMVLWENPVDTRDAVVRMNVSPEYWRDYTRERIVNAASRYFDFEYVGPALHEPTREVYRFTRKQMEGASIFGFIRKGGGGAKGAFEYADGRRVRELEHILGWKPFAGSLNIRAAVDFPWDENYYRAQLLDVADRDKGLEGAWVKKWVRLYPVTVKTREEVRCVALRFEAEEYPNWFVELVGDKNLSLPVGAPFVIDTPWRDGKTHEPVVQIEMLLRR